MKLVKLLALESDDLPAISTHMQDAVIRIADINFDLKTRQFVMVANRFEAEEDGSGNIGHRRRTGIAFSQVEKARSKKIRQGAAEAVLSLLSIEFAAGKNGPEGVIKLLFSGGGNIELDVECVEVQMEDLGPRWSTTNIPSHEHTDD